MLGTEIQHLLCFRDASDHRASNRSALHDQVEYVRRWVWRGGRADQRQRTITLEQHQKRIKIVGGCDGVENEVETLGMCSHFFRVARYDDLIGA
ncbi:hypothetical protein D3C73_1394240 [compost metagenome]